MDRCDHSKFNRQIEKNIKPYINVCFYKAITRKERDVIYIIVNLNLNITCSELSSRKVPQISLVDSL